MTSLHDRASEAEAHIRSLVARADADGVLILYRADVNALEVRASDLRGALAEAVKPEPEVLPKCICGHHAHLHVGFPGFFSCLICGGKSHMYQPVLTTEEIAEDERERAWADHVDAQRDAAEVRS